METGQPPPPEPQDPYADLRYGRLFDWSERLQREAPFLIELLQGGPAPSLLDLGCGSGEHAAFFARAGYRVLGVDRSAAQIAAARAQAQEGAARFVAGDLTRLGEVVDARFGTAICLGNTLVHLQEPEALAAACRGVYAALLPGGAWVAQILNYERLFGRGERHLPLVFRRDDDGEIVFLRLLQPLPDGRVQFFPTTLRLRPDAAVPVEVVASHATTLRAWQRQELEPALRAAGFTTVVWYGDLRGNPFDPESSGDLVFVARRDG